jgi:hypothetical protein
MKIGQEISITLTAPRVVAEAKPADGKPTPPIDGSGPWPFGDKGDANAPNTGALTPEAALAASAGPPF